MTGSQFGPALLVAAVGLAACGAGASLPDPNAEKPLRRAEVPVTKEEASLLVAGRLIKVYGLDADPVPVHVLFEPVMLDGEPVWRVRALVEVTLGGKRVERPWTVWVGQKDEQPAVLRSVGPVE